MLQDSSSPLLQHRMKAAGEHVSAGASSSPPVLEDQDLLGALNYFSLQRRKRNSRTSKNFFSKPITGVYASSPCCFAFCGQNLGTEDPSTLRTSGASYLFSGRSRCVPRLL